MAENDINRWHDTITPREKAPQPWSIGSGGSWDMLDVQPIPDEMLAELMQRYQYSGTPWNCRSLPLSPNDREYMFLLFYSMQGLVARMRAAEKRADAAALSTPPAVPSDWRMVPAEPTDEMRLAFWLEWKTSHSQGDGQLNPAYQAMLSAAPAAPQPQKEQPK